MEIEFFFWFFFLYKRKRESLSHDEPNTKYMQTQLLIMYNDTEFMHKHADLYYDNSNTTTPPVFSRFTLSKNINIIYV